MTVNLFILKFELLDRQGKPATKFPLALHGHKGNDQLHDSCRGDNQALRPIKLYEQERPIHSPVLQSNFINYRVLLTHSFNI